MRVQGKGARAVRYQSCISDDPIFLHPRSALHKTAPNYVAYGGLLATDKRTYMSCVSAIDPAWLAEAGAPLARLSAPLPQPPPAYSVREDAVLAWREVSYGAHGWALPLHAGTLHVQ
jgi:ATP-dependent RNA helicase DHX37/DHR1